MVPGWWFIALRSFMGAVNRPEPALWITLAAIPINTLLAYALIFGAFGLPRLEMTGAGVATTLVNIGMCVGRLLGLPTRAVRSGNIACSAASGAPDWPLMGKLIVVGAPISGSFLLEYGLVLHAAAVMVGWLGTIAARGASDRAADRGDRVHGAVRHFDGGDRACRPGGGPQRSARSF